MDDDAIITHASREWAIRVARESTPDGWKFIGCKRKHGYWTATWDTGKPGDFRYGAVAFESYDGLRFGLRELVDKVG